MYSYVVQALEADLISMRAQVMHYSSENAELKSLVQSLVAKVESLQVCVTDILCSL